MTTDAVVAAAAADDRRQFAYRFCRDALFVGLKLNNRFKAYGREHVPATGSCIIAANHVSFLDPPAVGCGARHRVVRFMARDTLFKGFFGRLLRRICVIPLSREKGDIAALRKAIELLKSGYCVGLFPEGTRSPDGQLKPPKSGIGFLIAKAGVPVIPAYVRGSYEAYPKGARWVRPHHVSIIYGQQIDPEDIASIGSGRGAYDQVGQLVMSRIAALRDMQVCADS